MPPTKNPDDRAQVSEAEVRAAAMAMARAKFQGWWPTDENIAAATMPEDAEAMRGFVARNIEWVNKKADELLPTMRRALEAAALTRAPGAGVSGDRDSIIEECAEVCDWLCAALKKINDAVKGMQTDSEALMAEMQMLGVKKAAQNIRALRLSPPDISGKSDREITDQELTKIIATGPHIPCNYPEGHPKVAELSQAITTNMRRALAALARKSPPLYVSTNSASIGNTNEPSTEGRGAAKVASPPVLAGTIPEGWLLVRAEPTEEMWGGLARDIVFWDRYPTHGGDALHRHLKSLGRPIPDWLAKEIPDSPQVPPKGTVAACIYKAMLAASSPAVQNGWRDIATAPKDGKRILLCSVCEDLRGGEWGYFDGPFPGLYDSGWRWGGDGSPTHWQPLPAVPTPNDPVEDGGRE